MTFLTAFFMLKFNHKEVIKMFKDELLDKIFSNSDMQKIPVGYQSTSVKVFEDVLNDMRGDNPNATISELFSANE